MTLQNVQNCRMRCDLTGRVIAFLACGLLGFALPAAVEAALIRLKNSVTVESPLITLGDIAEILDNDPKLVARLKGLPLAPAPPPGRQLQLDFDSIRARLAARGFDLTAMEFAGRSEVVISGAPRPAFDRQPVEPRKVGGPALTPRPPIALPKVSDARRKAIEAEVAAAVTKTIHRRYAESEKVCVKAQTKEHQLALLLTVNSDGFESDGGRPPFDIPQVFEIRFTDRNGMAQVAHVNCDVSPQPKILTVSSNIPKGHILEADDLVWRQAADPVPNAALDEIDRIVGRETTRSLKPDLPILPTDICEVALIRAGDIVTVYSRRRGIVVRMIAKARTTGALGESVELTSLDGKEKLHARVTRFHEAEIIASETSAAALSRGSDVRFVPAAEEKAP